MPSSLWWMMWSDMIFVASCPARFTLRSYPKFTIGNCAAEHLFPALSPLERDDAEENDNTGELVPGDDSLPARTRHHRDVPADFRSGGAQLELGKFNHRVWRDAHRAPVFEFHLGAAILLGLDLYALSKGQIRKCFFVTLPRVAVNLDVAVDIAQPHNSDLRSSKRANG